MVVARCLEVTTKPGKVLFDYGACAWPEGMLGNQMVYFNAPSVEEVVTPGFVDDEERAFAERIREAMGRSSLPRMDVAEKPAAEAASPGAAATDSARTASAAGSAPAGGDAR